MDQDNRCSRLVAWTVLVNAIDAAQDTIVVLSHIFFWGVALCLARLVGARRCPWFIWRRLATMNPAMSKRDEHVRRVLSDFGYSIERILSLRAKHSLNSLWGCFELTKEQLPDARTISLYSSKFISQDAASGKILDYGLRITLEVWTPGGVRDERVFWATRRMTVKDNPHACALAIEHRVLLEAANQMGAGRGRANFVL